LRPVCETTGVSGLAPHPAQHQNKQHHIKQHHAKTSKARTVLFYQFLAKKLPDSGHGCGARVA
jgi:hypothetical protein